MGLHPRLLDHYSDLMVPSLVSVNVRYYGWRVALYIAAVMYASIVVTALLLDGSFAALGITPQSARAVEEVSRFALDYTLFLNVAAVAVAATLVWLSRRDRDPDRGDHDHGDSGGPGAKRLAALAAAASGALGAMLYLAGV